jgi:release factor glutamine methyltransferase
MSETVMPNHAPPTIHQLLRAGEQDLIHTSFSARLDAEVLLMHVSGLSRAQLVSQGEQTLPAATRERFAALIARRRAGEPVAYLTGEREFWSLPLRVTPAVLVPRPETELLVERALELIPPNAAWLVADLGTGSGAIALALAHERPKLRVIATDASGEALAVARDNAARLGLGNVEFRQGDWLAPLANERFDLIVSNPPYVPNDDPHWAQRDLQFEPSLAIVGGLDGLAAIRHIAAAAHPYLRPGGWLLLEHGYDQGEAAADILRAAGYTEVTGGCDLAGHERAVAGRAP